MVEVKQDFAIVGSFVFASINSLANGSSDTSSRVDLGNPGPYYLTTEIKLDGATATASQTVEIFAKWSIDDTDYPTDDNDLLVGVVQMSGITAVTRVIDIPVIAQYLKLRINNSSGDSFAGTGNSAEYLPVHTDAN